MYRFTGPDHVSRATTAQCASVCGAVLRSCGRSPVRSSIRLQPCFTIWPHLWCMVRQQALSSWFSGPIRYACQRGRNGGEKQEDRNEAGKTAHTRYKYGVGTGMPPTDFTRKGQAHAHK
jgi:hypothetical protein